MEQKPYHVNILVKMRALLKLIYKGSFSSKICFKDHGELLEKSVQPKKEDDVVFIVESLEKMIKACNGILRLEGIQNYLTELIEKIRMIFFKTPLIEFFIDKKDVKIILNDGTEVTITGGSLSVADNYIVGITPEEKDVTILFCDIKLKGGIRPLTTKEMLDKAGWEPIPSGEKGLYTKKSV